MLYVKCIIIYYFDVHDYDFPLPQKVDVLHNTYEELKFLDHTKYIDDYLIKNISYNNQLSVLFDQWCEVVIVEMHRCLNPISGSQLNITRSSKPYWTKRFFEFFKEARYRER